MGDNHGTSRDLRQRRISADPSGRSCHLSGSVATRVMRRATLDGSSLYACHAAIMTNAYL